ncbi:hypothetical protein NPIL_568901 [Nephila pilipes]|uniref:Uncharacterized protein n=1 Tax=Nephila pilipes TaxID=299642 RepID=A0A8X6QYD1_NEPPI|nr:hypothetical protein NPIL_568901 [Nephila pilipes]
MNIGRITNYQEQCRHSLSPKSRRGDLVLPGLLGVKVENKGMVMNCEWALLSTKGITNRSPKSRHPELRFRAATA